MPTYKDHDKDIIRVLSREIKVLQRRVKHLENSRYTTLPMFDVSLGEVPDPTPEGLIFISAANQLRFFSQGTIYNLGNTP